MSVTIELELPDALVNEARKNGLLESASVGELLISELRRRKAAAALNIVLEGIRSQPGTALSQEEVNADIVPQPDLIGVDVCSQGERIGVLSPRLLRPLYRGQ